MIRNVEIERFSLLEDITVEFSAGFNAISGETGAGKTLLLDAIDFALGARASSQIFPSTGSRCRVAITVEVSSANGSGSNSEPRTRLKPGAHVIERIARPGGGGRITLDDEKVSAADIRRIAAGLVDYSGQTENRILLNPNTHTGILDTFGDVKHTRLLADYAGNRHEHIKFQKQLELIDRGDAARAARERLLEMEIEELGALNVQPGEYEELGEKRLKLVNAGRIVEEAARIKDALAGDETLGGGARDILTRAETSARLLAKYLGENSKDGEQWLALADDLATMESGLGEVESAANATMSGIESDPIELESVQARIAGMDRMALKYGCTPDELPVEQKSREYELSTLSGGNFDRDNILTELGNSWRECDRLARELSKSREKAAGELTRRVAKYLDKLDFAHSHFEVVGLMDSLDDFSEESNTSASGNHESDTETRIKRVFREHGYDDIEFLVALNPGEPARPLARVASGGEMSRLMLAITASLAGHAGTPVLMFDEIEAGVGGLTAEAVTEVMQEIAKSHQVIAVTHLAQVAGRAELHFAVHKETSMRTARIRIRPMIGTERRVELARMLGTDDPSKAERILDEILRI